MGSASLRLGAALALLVLTAGCLSGAAGTGSPTPETKTPETTVPGTKTPETTQTPWSHQRAMKQPDPDKAVELRNEWNRSVEMRVRVVREATGETVYEGVHDLAPGAEREVYSTAEADPDGVEAFRVVVTARNATQRVTIETSECYGGAYGTVREDGSLYLFYAIC